jgi:TRAP-type uncharacterized transport system fused permease subunit
MLIQRLEVIGSAWTALACYLFMCVASYYLGQKYFPIPYRIGRMMAWIFGAVLVYFLMESTRHWLGGHLPIILLCNSVFVGAFLFLIYKIERPLLRQVMGKAG